LKWVQFHVILEKRGCFMGKIYKKPLVIVPIAVLCAFTLALSTCDLFSNSMVDYYEEYSTMVTGINYDYDFTKMVFKGRVYIPPVSEVRSITVALRNTRRYELSAAVIDNGNTGSPVTATVLDTDTILVDLPAVSFTAGTSYYDVTLKLVTDGGLRTFDVKLPPIYYGYNQTSIGTISPGATITLPQGVVWVDTTIPITDSGVTFLPDPDGTMLVRYPPLGGLMITVGGELQLGPGDGPESLIIDGYWNNSVVGVAQPMIFVPVGGDLTMKDGVSLQNNYHAGNAGAVAVDGIFNMEGGTITGNKANDEGGGVQVGGTFNMSGGAITNNIAGNGGGINVRGNPCYFNMSGGTISNNKALGDGGGLYVNGYDGSANFTMTGGSIIYNEAVGGGGAGVNMWPTGATGTGTAGVIQNNVAASTKGDLKTSGGAFFSGTFPFVCGYQL
jgi:hypothetical protein